MALAEEEKAELRRLTMLKMAVDSIGSRDFSPDANATEQIIARAEKFDKYVVGEQPDEKS